jgi:hypothetical protein
MDLNRMLSLYADEAERVEYALVKLWYRATTGITDQAAVDAATKDVLIHYPDEFATVDIAQAAADVRDVVTMQVGQTATAEARKRGVRIVLTDADDKLLKTIDAEIDAQQAQLSNPQQQATAFRERVTAAAPIKPQGQTQPMATTTVQ